MLTIRKAGDRGHGDHGWLDSWHTFSFADYRDPAHNGFRVLRVMNEDRVAPAQGFDTHPHRDMEILSYVLEGALQHRDSLGHEAVMHPGEVQRITAGTGIEHSEFNPSVTKPVHFYQIWLFPDRRGHAPSYDQKAFQPVARKNAWQTIVSPDGRSDSLAIQQNALILLADLDANRDLPYRLAPDRHAWLQVLRGDVIAETIALKTGDGLAISDLSEVRIRAASDAELMLIDLP